MKALLIFISLLFIYFQSVNTKNDKDVNLPKNIFGRSKRQQQIFGPSGGGANCPIGMIVINGQVSYSFSDPLGQYPTGTIASAFCNPGYFFAGTTSPEAICQNGQWFPPSLGPCNPLGPGVGAIPPPNTGVCGRIPVPINGQIEYSMREINLSQYLPGTEAILYCSIGGISGSEITRCHQNGVWQPPLGSCVGTGVGGFGGGGGPFGGIGTGRPGIIGINNGAECFGGPLTPLNGQLRYSTGSIFGPWPPGAIAKLNCNPGYIPNGAIESICINGQFNPLGQCIGGGGGIFVGK